METVKVEILLTKVETKLVDQLVASGLYGLNAAGVIERLVAEGLRSRIAAGDLALKLPKE